MFIAKALLIVNLDVDKCRLIIFDFLPPSCQKALSAPLPVGNQNPTTWPLPFTAVAKLVPPIIPTGNPRSSSVLITAPPTSVRNACQEPLGGPPAYLLEQAPTTFPSKLTPVATQ